MRNLSKVLLVSLFMAMTMTANAQLQWGVKAGLNVSSSRGFEDRHEKDDDGSYDLEQGNKAGFHVGVAAQYLFTPQVGIETGLYYSTLGTKVTGERKEKSSYYNYSNKSETTFNPSYLQLPVSVLYKFNLGQDLYLSPSAGLYVGYGIGGKITSKRTEKYTDGSDTDEDTIETSSNFFGKQDDDDGEEITNRLDIGLTLGLTLQYSKFTFGLGYDYGLTPVDKKIEDESSSSGGYKYYLSKDGLKNGNIKVSVGYFF